MLDRKMHDATSYVDGGFGLTDDYVAAPKVL
jgi:hypothetical protein